MEENVCTYVSVKGVWDVCTYIPVYDAVGMEVSKSKSDFTQVETANMGTGHSNSDTHTIYTHSHHYNMYTHIRKSWTQLVCMYIHYGLCGATDTRDTCRLQGESAGANEASKRIDGPHVTIAKKDQMVFFSHTPGHINRRKQGSFNGGTGPQEWIYFNTHLPFSFVWGAWQLCYVCLATQYIALHATHVLYNFSLV